MSKGSEKIILALLWRYILKFDLDDPDGATDGLLEWVQPRTEEHYEVQNFTTSWKNGIGLLALFDNICPGIIDMEEIKDNEDDVEEHLAQSFDLFEEHLGVAKFLEVQDLMVPKPDKKSVMCYIASIKNATGRHQANKQKAQEDANAGHKARGEELYAQGCAKYVQASADDESHLADIVEQTVPELGSAMELKKSTRESAMKPWKN